MGSMLDCLQTAKIVRNWEMLHGRGNADFVIVRKVIRVWKKHIVAKCPLLTMKGVSLKMNGKLYKIF